MRWRPRGLCLAVVTALAATTACFGGDDGETAAAGGGAALRWSDCTEASLTGLQCATLTVPVDHTQPDGPTLEIALARKQASGKKSSRIGSLVVNPGGPGASGIDLAASLATSLSDDLLERFDLVGFDPRGVGRSSPVRCIDDLDASVALDGDPDTPDEVADLEENWTSVAATCRDRYADLLPHLSTAETARDLDALRAALGDRKLTYLGFSYGTQLGAAYATLFPDNVRALVLDGAVAPGLSAETLSRTQAEGFEVAFNNFVDACRTDQQCAAYPDAAAVYARAAARAERSPLPVARAGESRTVSAGVFQTGVAAALYDQSLWGFLARGLVEAAEGDGTTLLGLADIYTQRKPDGTFANLADANRAINCADQTERPSMDDAAKAATGFASQAPRFGPSAGWAVASCADWPAGAERAVTAQAPAGTPILVVGTTGDPATPYVWAAQLAAAMGPAPLLTWEGEGHTAYPKTDCVTEAVDTFLLKGTLPPDGTRCPADREAGSSAFEGIGEEVRKALVDSGLPEAVAQCIADKVEADIQPADLAAASSGELPEELSAQMIRYATECATQR